MDKERWAIDFGKLFRKTHKQEISITMIKHEKIADIPGAGFSNNVNTCESAVRHNIRVSNDYGSHRVHATLYNVLCTLGYFNIFCTSSTSDQRLIIDA